VESQPDGAAPQDPDDSSAWQEAERPLLRASYYYGPFPRQIEFHRCTAKYRLFGGAAGPGKTKALLWEAIRQANKWPRVDTLLLRRTFPELEASLISQFRRDVPRWFYQSYNEAKHIVTWHNGSTTRFGYSASENDIYQYQGAEFLFIGVDELTLFTLGQWQFLTSRNRCPNPRATPNMAGATNPGNIGHAWVKALWVDRRPAPGMDRPGQYDPDDYAFIRATIADNPLYRDDADYLKTLDALPRHLRQAFLEGDWNVFAGQYFDIFDMRCHTGRAEQLGLEPWWPRWVSIDWGFEHPSAVYWHGAGRTGSGAGRALRPSEQAGSEEGPGVVTYREFVQNHLSPGMLAQAIAERSKGEKIGAVYLSPDAFARHSSESTIADQLGEVLERNGLPRPTPADDDRVGGWMLIYQMLQEGRWVIAENCVRLVECLPTLVRDPANVEDVQKMDGDDPADSARYGLKSRLGAARAPLEVRVSERIGTADPTSRAIWTQKFLAEERRAAKPPALPHRHRPPL
jgi:terminase large subunit-like protein